MVMVAFVRAVHQQQYFAFRKIPTLAPATPEKPLPTLAPAGKTADTPDLGNCPQGCSRLCLGMVSGVFGPEKDLRNWRGWCQFDGGMEGQTYTALAARAVLRVLRRV